MGLASGEISASITTFESVCSTSQLIGCFFVFLDTRNVPLVSQSALCEYQGLKIAKGSKASQGLKDGFLALLDHFECFYDGWAG